MKKNFHSWSEKGISQRSPLKRSFHYLLTIALACLFLSGCASIDREAVLAGIEAGSPSGRLIKGVPFFPQKEKMCGPAALSSVLGYWGEKIGLDEAKKAVYAEKLEGTLPMDLIIHAREKGYDAKFYRGGFDDLKSKVSDGNPLILFLNLGYDFYPIGHYIVVVGYSEGKKVVLAHSGMNREEAFTFDRLDSLWKKTNYSTILIKPGAGK